MKKAIKTSDLAEQGNLFTSTSLVNDTRPVEISPEKKQERAELSGLLLQKTENLVRERLEKKKQRDQEVIELIGGGTTSLGALKRLVMNKRQPYEPQFPNSSLFFPEIFRLNNWHSLDPKRYIKPREVGRWVKELIYDRFSLEVLPTLRKLNPKSITGGRAHKHFQYLTSEGQAELGQYREEAITLMQACSDWYEFRVKLHQVHGVSYQTKLFVK